MRVEASPDRIDKIELDESLGVHRNALIEAERALAVRDLLEGNLFHVRDLPARGPYYVRVGIDGYRLHFRVRAADKTELPEIPLPLGPFRRLVRDYFLICESYQAAYAGHDRTRLETIDMARRGLHDEGAALLRERLDVYVQTDMKTARALFTLVCILHIGVTQPW